MTIIKFLQELWERITAFLFPDDYFSWQTLVYLGLFSFVMSWIARLSEATAFTETVIATAGWLFFALGIGWLFEENKIRLAGISLAPWVTGAIVSAYFFALFPWGEWEIGLMTWPLVSVAIAAIPQFFTWELKPKVPAPLMRHHLILLLLLALLLSNWFQFYFRLQEWFEAYPSLLADDFGNSGFVYRVGVQPEDQAKGSALLAAAEAEVEATLENTPWPYVERWLLNLNDQVVKIQLKTANTLDGSLEKDLWRLEARPRSLNDGYALDLMAVWSGPASDPNGYYLEKTCIIQPQSRPQPVDTENEQPARPTQMAAIKCELATPKRMGKPTRTT